MIHLQQLRYEQLKELAIRCNVLMVRDTRTGAANAHPAFQAIEQVLRELSILQKRYMLHLHPSDVDLSLIRVLLKLSFNAGGKAKVNALVRELQGHNDSLEHTLALCNHQHFPKSRDYRHQPSAWQSLDTETAMIVDLLRYDNFVVSFTESCPQRIT